MNNVSISGRTTKDIELRHTQSGVPVCSFSVAVDRPGVKDTTDFLDCVAWRKSAEFANKYFHKGDRIAQFRVVKSQPQLEFVPVRTLGGKGRGGFGSTGVK